MEITTLQQAVDIIMQLQEQNRQQQEQNKAQQEQVKVQQQQIKQLQDENKQLAKKVEKLCAQLHRYHNVNTPSGALPPYLKSELFNIVKSPDEKDHPDSKQVNNNRNKRSEQDRIEIHQVDFCPHCGSTNLKQREKTNKRIVLHMHFPKVETVMHESKNCFCMDCKKEISPQVSNTLPKSKYDLNISILIVLLYAIGTTQSKTQEILRWFGVEMCKTSVNNTIHRVQKYLGDRKYRELEEELKNSFFCGADETSHRHMGKTFWIWVATTANTVFFRIAQSRGSKEAKKLPLAKIASCDGYRAYDKTTKRIQRCWAHLMRRLRDPSLMFNEQWEMEQFISFVKNVSSLYKQAKKESRRGTAIKQEYERKLTEIIQSKYKEEQNLVHALNYIIEYFDNWFTFLKYSGVESTNNRAERALRPLVVQRKVSQHTWSEEGREGLAITQTLYQTSKLRNEDFAQLIRQEIETGLHERGNY